MRTYLVGLFGLSLVVQQLAGQARPASPPPLPQVACPMEGCNVGNSHVVHISSSSNVRLENGVLHYVTGQVLQNNGGENAEVIWTLPLPPSAAFQNLTMSFNGEMLLGEIYTKGRARAIYDAIVATKKDPALVEWSHRNLLTTRIYPIVPGETKYLEMRMQAVARRTANVIRVDYFAGSNYARHLTPETATVTMSFSYPDSVSYGVPYSSTHVVGSPTISRGMRTVTVSGKRTDVSLFLPVNHGGSGSISVLPHAVAGEDGYALLNIVAPVLPQGGVITDVRVRAWPVELKEIDSTALTTMHPGESRTVALRYRGSGKASITVSGIAGGRNLSWSTRTEFPREEIRNAFAARLFATDKIGDLELRRTLGCGPANADSVTTALGFRHAIPSPMTSYLVLEPSVRIDENGQVTNAADFATKPSTTSAAPAAGGKAASATANVATQKPASSNATAAAKPPATTPGSGKGFTVSGVARDGATGAPLGLAVIEIANSPYGAVTDKEGRYTIANVPPGLHTISAKRVGYSPTVITDLRVASRDAVMSDIKLNVQALMLSAVVTTGVVDPASGTRAPFTVATVGSERLEVAALGQPVEVLASRVASIFIRGNEPLSDRVIQLPDPSVAIQSRDSTFTSAQQRVCNVSPRGG